MYLQKFLTPVVLASLLIGQGYPAAYAQQPGQTTPAQNQASPPGNAPAQVLLADGTDVPLVFDEDLSSKTAVEGDQITLVLAEDLKVGDFVVAKAGAKAQGEVTNAKKAGMMGKAGELDVYKRQGPNPTEIPEKHTAGAEARIDSARLTARLKSCPDASCAPERVFPQPVKPALTLLALCGG